MGNFQIFFTSDILTTFFSMKKNLKISPKNLKNFKKNIFWKSWKKIRTSRSKQNFTADRMEALSTSENHSKAQLLSKHVFFHDFCAKPVRRLGMGPLKKFLKEGPILGAKLPTSDELISMMNFSNHLGFFLENRSMSLVDRKITPSSF